MAKVSFTLYSITHIISYRNFIMTSECVVPPGLDGGPGPLSDVIIIIIIITLIKLNNDLRVCSSWPWWWSWSPVWCPAPPSPAAPAAPAAPATGWSGSRRSSGTQMRSSNQLMALARDQVWVDKWLKMFSFALAQKKFYSQMIFKDRSHASSETRGLYEVPVDSIALLIVRSQ